MSQPGEQEPAPLQPATATLPPAVPPAPPAVAHRPRPLLSWTAALGTLIVAILFFRTLVAYPLLPVRLSHPSPPTDSSQQSTDTASAPDVQFTAISMSSTGSGWALGFSNGSAAPSFGPLLLRYNGHDWERADSPDSQQLFTIAAVSDDEAWATGANGIFHYQDGVWHSDYQLTDANTYLSAIAMVSSDEGWALGTLNGSNGPSPLVLHRLHGVWRPEQIAYFAAPTGDSIILHALSMRSPTEGWLTGLRYTNAGNTGFALHYTGGRWVEDDAGLVGSADAIAAVAPGEAWAVGTFGPEGPGFIAHYSGGIWRQVPTPTSNMLHAIAMLSPTQGWIAGDGAATLRLTAQGWVKEGLIIHGVALSGISMPSLSEGWAVGGTVMLHYKNGAWSVYHLTLGPFASGMTAASLEGASR
jgi:hypothetical protein